MLLPSYSKTGMYNYAAPTNTISCTYIIKPISENEIKADTQGPVFWTAATEVREYMAR